MMRQLEVYSTQIIVSVSAETHLRTLIKRKNKGSDNLANFKLKQEI